MKITLCSRCRGEWMQPQDLDWEEEGEKDDRNEANKHFEYYMMALVEGPKVGLLSRLYSPAVHFGQMR